MTPRNLGIEMDQGADFNITLGVFGELGPVDITGYSFLAEMRPLTDLTAPVEAEFDFAIQDQFTNKGQVQWSLPVAEVDAIVLSVANPLSKQRLKTPFLFDVKMKDTMGAITRILQGVIYICPQATLEVFP